MNLNDRLASTVLSFQYCSVQGLGLDATTDAFTSPAACTAPSNTMKASHQGACPSAVAPWRASGLLDGRLKGSGLVPGSEISI